MAYRKQKRAVLLQLISEKSQELFKIFLDTGRNFDSEIKAGWPHVLEFLEIQEKSWIFF